MTKGLFTSTEEIYFQDLAKGRITPLKGASKERRDIKQENRRIAQNVRRQNSKTTPSYIRTR